MTLRTRTTRSAGLLFTLVLSSVAVGACDGGTSGRESGSSGTAATISAAAALAKGDARIATALAGGGLVAGEGGFKSRAAGALATHDLSVTVPARANDASLLMLPEGSLRLAPREANTATGVLNGGVLVYPNAFSGVDRLVTSNAVVHEELFLIHSASARSVFEWDIELSPDLVRATPDASGGLSFVDREGNTALHIPAPYAIDAKGARASATLAWNADERRLRVALNNPSTLAYPVLLDPAFEVGVWQQMAVPVKADSELAAYDAARGRIVRVSAGVTWTSNGQAWARAADSGPSARALSAMAYDAERQRMVLFGGLDGAPLSDTWEWDGTTWTNVFSASYPPARYGHSVAYDPVRGRVVLFGGVDSNAVALGDMWEWDGKTWTKITPATVPSARAGQTMMLDANRKKVVLFGGGTLTGTAVATALDETWEWDGVTWTKAAPATSPSARSLAPLAYDATKKRVVLFGGEAAGATRTNDYWEFDGTTWTQITMPVTKPGTRAAESLSYDPAHKVLLLAGGAGGDAPTWSWDGSAWSTFGTVEPGRLMLPSMAYDSARKKVVMVGGSTPLFANAFLGNTWEWDGKGWTDKGTAGFVAYLCSSYFFNGFTGQWECGDTFPTANYSSHVFAPALAYDATRAVTVLFGGTGWQANEGLAFINGSTPFTRQVHLNDTWTYNGTVWTKKSPAHSPPARREAAMVNAGTKLVLFGGRSGTTLSDLWTWNGTDWTQPTTTGTAPTARSAVGAAYDAARGVVVFFGGATNTFDTGYSATLDDTFEFNPTTNVWTKKSPAHKPTAEAFAAMDYDTIHSRVTLFANAGSATTGTIKTWTWNGDDWTDVSVSTAPSARRFPRAVFDSARGQFVMHGGADPTTIGVATGETWTYYTRGGPDCTTNSECQTGYCTDGVCCEVPSCGTCEACNVGGSLGVCAKVRSAADADSCTGSKSCDVNGTCKSSVGQACGNANDCNSGFCVDGVCCDTECKGSCQACSAALNAAGADGTCGPTKAGIDPRNECDAEDVTTCGRDGFCDGKGGCAKVANGVSCATENKPSACSGNRAVGWICNGLGSCGNTVEGTDCDPFVCNLTTGGCTTTCERDVDCVATAKCDVSSGKCVAKGGAVCKDDYTVVDPNGTESDCRPFKCNAGACVTVTVCLEDGHTLLKEDKSTIDCAPFACAGNACVETCSSLAQCASPAVCGSDGRCVPPTAETPPDDGGSGGCSCTTVPSIGAGASALRVLLGAGLVVVAMRRRRARAA